MTLDDLYGSVTEAILRAEALEARELEQEAALAYQDVSRIEEAIAAILPANDPEGALARQGVVTAAISAGDLARAFERACSYGADESLHPAFRAPIEALRKEAAEKPREPRAVPVALRVNAA